MRPAVTDMPMGNGGAGVVASTAAQQPGFGYGVHAAVEPPPFWSTPTPYLFIGFAVVMSLIAVALAVLLCSRRREEEEEESRRRRDGEVLSVRVLAPLDREDAALPKVVVVMAGDHAPSFLASVAPLAYYGAAAAKAAQMPQYGAGDKESAAAAAAAV
ncbi:hypothetical protein ACP4OV_009386 [Aristida adscensionis]